MLRRLRQEILSDHLLMVASGMAFHGVIGALPALGAVALVWKLLLGPETLEASVETSRTILPDGAADLMKEFVTSVPQGLGLGIGLMVNLLVILWSAQRAASGLITALNIVYEEREAEPDTARGGGVGNGHRRHDLCSGSAGGVGAAVAPGAGRRD